jgi:hypothetical protein
MASFWNEWLEKYAAEHNLDIEDFYYHAYRDFTFRKSSGEEILIRGWGGGTAASPADARIISRFYRADNNVPTGALGKPLWREAIAAYFENHQAEFPDAKQTGLLFDSWMAMFTPDSGVEHWAELIAEGATDHESAIDILKEHYMGFLVWIEDEMKRRLGRDKYDVVPNIAEPSYVNLPMYTDPRYKWYEYEVFMASGQNGYYKGASTRKPTWEWFRIFYDMADRGINQFCQSQTNMQKELALQNYDNITEDNWHGFCQQVIAA